MKAELRNVIFVGWLEAFGSSVFRQIGKALKLNKIMHTIFKIDFKNLWIACASVTKIKTQENQGSLRNPNHYKYHRLF